MARNEEDLQQRLRSNDRMALREVYLAYKQDFKNFFRTRTVEELDLDDLYHESVVALHQNFVMKQLSLEKASIKSYLFGIGKNKLLQVFKGKKNLAFTQVSPEMEGVYDAHDVLDTMSYPIERRRQLGQAFGKLGDKCQELIKLYYYQGFTIKEMVMSTSYKDENTVKSYKSRCMKKLKALINS